MGVDAEVHAHAAAQGREGRDRHGELLEKHQQMQREMAIAALPFCHPKFGLLQPEPLPTVNENQAARARRWCRFSILFQRAKAAPA
jgi:hypothetical protein